MASLTQREVRDSGRGWPASVRVMHWVVGLLVLGQLLAAIFLLESFRSLFPVHFTVGITILALMVVRVLVRLFSPRAPALPPDVGTPQRVLARLNQITFYLLLFVIPLSGWIITGLDGSGPTIFGFITLPPLIVAPPGANMEVARGPYEVLHVYAAWVLAGAIVLHLAGVAVHALIRKDGVVGKMTSTAT